MIAPQRAAAGVPPLPKPERPKSALARCACAVQAPLISMLTRLRSMLTLATLMLAVLPLSASAAQTAPAPPYVTDDAAHAIGAAETPAATDNSPAERKVLVMLRLPAPHFRPDASYGGRYIDDGGRSARRRIAEDLAQLHGLKLVSDWPMPTLGVDCYVMEYGDADTGERIAAALSHDPRVEWAQPVALFRGMGAAADATAVTNATAADPLYPVQPSAKYWHIAELHRTTTGRNVNVAVVDSGIDQQHPDLLGQVALAENFVDGSSYLAEAHGTAVAGIIAARSGNGGIVGVAPGARLLALRACWQQPDLATRCSSFTLAKALNFAILNHAKVINLSLSGPSDRLLDRLLDVALERGIAVVGAVDPQGGGPAFPASHRGVIAVAQQAVGSAHAADATSAANAPRAGAQTMQAISASSSSSASSPTLATTGTANAAGGASPAATVYAPGRDVPTTAPGARWSFVSGSSYAAAHVSGMVALLSELRPSSTPDQLRRQLQPIDGLNAGNIDACATITRVTGACSCSCATAVSLKVDSHP